jgi:hypothetical protein
MLINIDISTGVMYVFCRSCCFTSYEFSSDTISGTSLGLSSIFVWTFLESLEILKFSLPLADSLSVSGAA